MKNLPILLFAIDKCKIIMIIEMDSKQYHCFSILFYCDFKLHLQNKYFRKPQNVHF